MEAFTFGGHFEDGKGREPITWEASPTDRSPPGFDLRTAIRGVGFHGSDFECLDPDDGARAVAAGLRLNGTGELHECLLSGDLPCAINDGGVRGGSVVTFDVDLRSPAPDSAHGLRLQTTVRGVEYEIASDLFEALLGLDLALPTEVALVCCLTCRLSDYSPAGQSLMGMLCHRDAREQYLAVRSKSDYLAVPVTEVVMETYSCPQYERRVAGTGYRG